jgi:cell division protein FtsZ
MRELAAAVDTLIVSPNDRIFQVANPRIPVRQAFRMVDSVVVEAVRGISDMIAIPGLVNVDFADVKAIMKGKGVALMGTGRGTGEERAILAAKQAISSPLLEDARIEGATGLLVTITGNQDMSLADIHDAMNLIQDATGADTNTIFGAIFDDTLGEEVKVTVVATGFDRAAAVRHHESQTTRLYSANRSTAVTQAPPPPPPRQAQLPSIDEVPLYAVAAAAHDRAASVSAQTQLPSAYAGHAHAAFHHADTQPLPAQTLHGQPVAAPQSPAHSGRPNLAANWGLPSHEHEFDQPAYLRRSTPGYGVPQVPGGSAAKREPVVHNPFAGHASELDCPAFRRK